MEHGQGVQERHAQFPLHRAERGVAAAIPGDTRYLGRARAGWDWVRHSGMINGGQLVNGGLGLSACRTNSGTAWAYYQGVLLGVLADVSSLKGGHLRRLAALDAAFPAHPYRTYLRTLADGGYQTDRTLLGQYGLCWYGPVERTDAAGQQSALHLLNAVLWPSADQP